ncbi:MAG: ABC transporter permease [Bacillota bacterium]
MRKILSMLSMDVKLITRNPIVLYMAIAPALLAFVYLAVLGNLGQGTMSFVVAKDVPAAIIKNLEKVGDVEIAADEFAVKQRVERFDSIAGVVLQDNDYKIVLEGNEGVVFSKQVSLLISRAVSNDIPNFTSEKIASKGNIIIELTAVSLLLTALFISSTVSGFNVVAERESKAIRALAVSPMSLRTFMSARTLIALLLGLGNIVLCVLIMGRSEDMIAFVLAAVCSVAVIALIAIGLGCTANNQIAAIASIKLIMPACLILPISSYFVPERFKMFYYWLPNYWQFESLLSAWTGSVNWSANIAMLVTGFVWLLVLYRFFQRKLVLR